MLPPFRFSADAPDRQITVFGAAGFIGRFVVDELRRRGWRVRAHVHLALSHPFATDVDVIYGDVRDRGDVRRALAGSVAVVNLAAAKSDESDSESVNVGGAQCIAECARQLGAIRIVHVSTQAVKIARQGIYARTKLAAERVVERSGLPVTILRPSVVYGPGKSGVFSTMQRFIDRLPLVPVLGDGRWTSAPVHVEDVARAIAVCLERPATIGRCYDLGGPDLVSLDTVLDRIAASRGKSCRKLHVPYLLALAAAHVLSRLLPNSPVTVSNVLGSNQKIPIDSQPAAHDFGFLPRSLDDGLQQMTAIAEAEALREEATRFARYLIGADIDARLVARYAAAVAARIDPRLTRDVAFVRRHGWALPFVDAAAALLWRTSPLRQRLVLMAAILETSPRHAEFFLAPPPRRLPLFLGLARCGVSSAFKLLGGFLLLPFSRPT